MSTFRHKIALLKRIIAFAVQENKWQERGRYGMLSETATLKKPQLIAVPSKVYLYPYSRLQSDAKILNYTGKFIMKPYSVCSDNLLVVTGNHVPTVGLPQFYLGNTHINDRERDVIIEEGAWVGANVTLLSGVQIGRGAVIGAGSVVKTKIPPYAVAVGNPAIIIATTFSKEQVLEHERIVFAEEDRLCEEFVRNLFDEKYADLASIGTSRVKIGDRTKYEEIIRFLSERPYK